MTTNACEELLPQDKKRRNLMLFLILFSIIYFLTPLPVDNILSRADLSASIINEKNVDINEYQYNTIDKSLYKNSFYSDKAPGLSFLSLPAAYIYSIFSTPDPQNTYFVQLLTIFAVSIPVIVLFSLFFLVIFYTSHNINISLTSCFTMAYGTLLLPYSTLFYGHATGAALSFSLFYIVFFLELTPFFIFFAGVLCSGLAIVEYPLALHSLFFAISIFYKLKEKKYFVVFLVGAIPFILCIFYYNYLCFGSIFSVGYMHENWEPFKNGMSSGIAGVTFPSINSFINILFNPGRGLFVISPVLFLSIPGALKGLKNKDTRLITTSAIILIFISILVNSSQYLPMGGMAPGPRHLVPVIPYLIFLTSFSLSIKNIYTYIYPLLTGFSFLTAMCYTTVEPHVHEVFNSTLFEFYIPTIAEGIFRESWISSKFPQLAEFSIVLYFTLVIVLIIYILNFQKHIFQKHLFFILCGIFIIISFQYFYFYTTSAISTQSKSYALASTWKDLGYEDIAYRKYTEIINKDPDNYMSQFGLGVIYFNRNQIYQAEKQFRAALLLNPSFSKAHFNLALILASHNQNNEAINHFLMAVSNDKNNDLELRATSYASIAMIYYNVGDSKEGAKYVKLAKNTASKNAYVEKVEKYFNKE